MSKSILILDTPKSCFFCRFRGEKPYYEHWEVCGDKFCTLTEMDNEEYYYAAFQDNYIRPEWCPLKALPEYDIPSIDPNPINCAYAQGWNDCLDIILEVGK